MITSESAIKWAPREWRKYVLEVFDKHGDTIHRTGRRIAEGWVATFDIVAPPDHPTMPERWTVLWKRDSRELKSIYVPGRDLQVYHMDYMGGPDNEGY